MLPFVLAMVVKLGLLQCYNGGYGVRCVSQQGRMACAFDEEVIVLIAVAGEPGTYQFDTTFKSCDDAAEFFKAETAMWSK